MRPYASNIDPLNVLPTEDPFYNSIMVMNSKTWKLQKKK